MDIVGLARSVYYISLLVSVIAWLLLGYYRLSGRGLFMLLVGSTLLYVLIPSMMLLLSGYLIQYVYILDIGFYVKASITLNSLLVITYCMLMEYYYMD